MNDCCRLLIECFEVDDMCVLWWMGVVFGCLDGLLVCDGLLCWL